MPTDRALTMAAIRAAVQRAADTQRAIVARAAAGPSGERDELEVPTISADPLDADLDLDLDLDGELPNPLITDANLHHHLQRATAHEDPTARRPGIRGLIGWARDRLAARRQGAYNRAMVHALHQLDHRTRHQQRTIARLEAELAEARRALAVLDRQRAGDR